MANKRILISWIGHADLKACVLTLPKTEQKRISNKLQFSLVGSDNDGPIKTLLNHEAFDEVHLIYNYTKDVGQRYKKWIGGKINLYKGILSNPTDYSEVFSIVNQTLQEIAAKKDFTNTELCFHLSPGTPTMTAIWVLLGKSKYPATFYQTHNGKAWKTEIPFDLIDDYIPDLLKHPDFAFQHLAAQKPMEIKGFEQITGKSQAIRLAAGRAKRAAIRDVSALILGESGTGKELFARAIHQASHRRDKPFIVINCAAIPVQLLESELFGHKKGAFTGAYADRAGAFEVANDGTLFLDEVGECDIAMQAKLLRALQPPPDKGPCYRVFRRIGENKDRFCDVRVIAATNRNLPEAITEQSFREDLYYRLAVITIKIPPLCERKSDIPLITDHLLKQINTEFSKQEPGYEYKTISVSTKKYIQNLDWQGNIRQLYNVLLQAAVMSEKKDIGKEDISAVIADTPSSSKTRILKPFLSDENFNLEEHLNSIRKQYLQLAMDKAHGVKTKASNLLGMKNYQTLDAQLKKFNIHWKEDE